MSFEKFHLGVVGAHSVLGAEVARLAIALGHDVTGFGPRPHPPELFHQDTWIHGVTWRRAHEIAHIKACDRLALCVQASPETSTHEVAPRARLLATHFQKDFVVVAPESTFDAQAWQALLDFCAQQGRSGRLVRMTPAEIMWTPGYLPMPPGALLDVDTTQRIETVAMAALRVMLEDERHGNLDAAQIAHLGDAMMIQ